MRRNFVWLLLAGLMLMGLLTQVGISLAGEDVWTRKADMPIARAELSTSVVDGKIYAIGGWRPPDEQLSIVEEYDPETDTWTRKTDMPTARSGLATCAVNGRIYAIGGGGAGVAVFGTVEEYDPLTDTWTQKADMPTSRLYHSASVVDGKIYSIKLIVRGSINRLGV